MAAKMEVGMKKLINLLSIQLLSFDLYASRFPHLKTLYLSGGFNNHLDLTNNPELKDLKIDVSCTPNVRPKIAGL